MKPWPVALRPLAEETLHSWMSRVAALYRMSLQDLVDYRRSELHHVMLDFDTNTLELLASLTRTTPDFVFRYTVGSWKNDCRLQWLTIRQTEPSWMFPHHEFRFQLTTNYRESCLLEDAATTRIEFFRLQWLLAPQTICPRHLTFLRETCRCCNRQVQAQHWRSKTRFALGCAWTRRPLAQEPYEYRDIPETARRGLASFEQSLLAVIHGRNAPGVWYSKQSSEDVLQVVCDLIWLLTRHTGSNIYVHHCLGGSYFRLHYRWPREPQAKPWLGDLRIRDRRSLLATLALLLDSEEKRSIFQNPQRAPFSTRTLFQILNADDQQELRHRITLWPAAFQPVASDLLAGLSSTGFLKSQSTH